MVVRAVSAPAARAESSLTFQRPVDAEAAFEALLETVVNARRLVVLSGAGCSTECGIPAYRDANGIWRRTAPVMYQDFVRSPEVRARYWARSIIGWQHFSRSHP